MLLIYRTNNMLQFRASIYLAHLLNCSQVWVSRTKQITVWHKMNNDIKLDSSLSHYQQSSTNGKRTWNAHSYSIACEISRVTIRALLINHNAWLDETIIYVYYIQCPVIAHARNAFRWVNSLALNLLICFSWSLIYLL